MAQFFLTSSFPTKKLNSPTQFITKKKGEKKGRTTMGLDRANPQATYTCQPLLIVVLAELFPVALHLLET